MMFTISIHNNTNIVAAFSLALFYNITTSHVLPGQAKVTVVDGYLIMNSHK